MCPPMFPRRVRIPILRSLTLSIRDSAPPSLEEDCNREFLCLGFLIPLYAVVATIEELEVEIAPIQALRTPGGGASAFRETFRNAIKHFDDYLSSLRDQRADGTLVSQLANVIEREDYEEAARIKVAIAAAARSDTVGRVMSHLKLSA
ncbi:UvrB/UvrC domain protein [Perilla frutescens var. hirtella]|uniref:UvrB/UvrC domain protein n=1 Tax=Perilla frutescens var. hirtella TaxID=608512 RepID=A0AAD4P3U9_PERFH|nr:UvrB/UvrC domain protein [Perilla frutescens var. hirtella]